MKHCLSRWSILFALLLWLGSITQPAAGNELEGPPDCSQLSKPVRYLMPAGRILVLDAAMYAGLVILWPDAFAPSAGSADQFTEAWTKAPYQNPHKVFIEGDDDPWVINGVLHPVYGSEVYLSARIMGHNGLVSFLYAMGASLTWEYLVEGWFHRPSAIDLAWTPFAGAVLGELRYQLVSLIARKVSRTVPRVIFTSVLDPIGQLERLFLGCAIACPTD